MFGHHIMDFFFRTAIFFLRATQLLKRIYHPKGASLAAFTLSWSGGGKLPSTKGYYFTSEVEIGPSESVTKAKGKEPDPLASWGLLHIRMQFSPEHQSENRGICSENHFILIL